MAKIRLARTNNRIGRLDSTFTYLFKTSYLSASEANYNWLLTLQHSLTVAIFH
jgi:hypothetical protein